MLKALELSGFKSFADKTRFDFPAGITVVVGPNGSGKSNIVDAIKWVLGEQSAKSLRGKDMSDVIFKGSSGANSRKAANSASATIILDNADGHMPNDSPEIHVTRRVYRSGESEYLINNEPCRLKDIRQLFRGTGVGTDAYSLIEQGKVERLLAAGAKDRRAIFEEAAGISRFKAQKVEAERRLDRVQTNLTRLADIVEEVGSRFRAIKNQASKAAKYKEYTTRLQDLRTFVGAKDYRSLTEKIELTATDIASLTDVSDKQKKLLESLSEQHRQAEDQVDVVAQEADRLQESINSTREQISQLESTSEINRQRKIDFEQRVDQVTHEAQRAIQRVSEFAKVKHDAELEFQNTEVRYAESVRRLHELEASLNEKAALTTQLQMTVGTARNDSTEVAAFLKELGEQISQLTVRVELQRQSIRKLDDEDSRLTGLIASQSELAQATEAEAETLQTKAEVADTALANSRKAVDEMVTRLAELQNLLSETKSQFSGLSQRAKMIEELEKRQEGISSGAQELMRFAKQPGHSLAGHVVGMVADLIEVNVQHAALIDASLGAYSQYIVVNSSKPAEQLASGELVVTGRVGLFSLQADPFSGYGLSEDLTNDEDVIGSIGSLVKTSPEYQPLIDRLLHGTWIVKDLRTALDVRQRVAGNARLITLSGEVVEPDGSLMVGPKSSAQGIISRRSELRSLVAEIAKIKNAMGEQEQGLSVLKKEIKTGEGLVQRLISENQVLAKELANLQARRTSQLRDLESAQKQLKAALLERADVAKSVTELETERAALQEEYATGERKQQRQLQLIQDSQSQIDALQSERQLLAKEETVLKVQVAKWDQQRSDLANRIATYIQQELENQQDAAKAEAELEGIRRGTSEAAAAIAECSSRLESLTADRERLSTEYNQHQTRRLELDRERKDVAQKLTKARDALRNAEDELANLNLRARQMEMEREQLASRLQEDYGISVAEVEAPGSSDQSENRDEIEREISELRQKIGSIGAVNMQALAELEELESRYQTLDDQYRDLVEARDALLKIIQKINNDSRRLFVETLEAIRINFQKLFRQTFGGGQADIVLEEGVDVLEAGVEIIATPPGKPKFSNSLLSGGEKALTAVSLLMAIFQFRPSPFCVLDEVDAPFDEANIGRFIDVLKSFLGWTKFVIVTHSKKTMTAATTLYGITMQESGISKRVSVKFEDVSDDGRISQEAINRSEKAADEQPAA